MRSKILGAVSFAAALMAAVLAVALAPQAQAQTATDPSDVSQPVKKKKPANQPAHVTVEKRSFLDAGTEVKPGQRKFTDYAFPPGYSPTSTIDFTTGNIRGPLIGPWDTSRNNFWPW
jgi:hypothetical protein